MPNIDFSRFRLSNDGLRWVFCVWLQLAAQCDGKHLSCDIATPEGVHFRSCWLWWVMLGFRLCQILNFEDLDYAKYWILKIWTRLNIEFWTFTLCFILNCQDLDYAKYSTLKILAMLNIEFWRFGVCLIVNFEGLNYAKYWIFKIWTIRNIHFWRFGLC